MKIEMWYDAVAQEIDILVNGKAVDKNDIFGFLYPVRNYPLQTWLYPAGSWKGLEYQLVDLAREEEVELFFHGREVDYEDICKCLENNSKIQTAFEEWDMCSLYDTLFTKLLESMKKSSVSLKKQFSSLGMQELEGVSFAALDEKASWFGHIYGDEDFTRFDENIHAQCCYVHDSFFTSYEKLLELQRLTRSLKIAADAIYCCFDTIKRKEDYQYYAEAHTRMGFHFCMEKENYYKASEEKYGKTAMVKQKVKTCRKVMCDLCEVYNQILENTKREYGQLAKDVVRLDSRQKVRFANLKQLRFELSHFMQGMELIFEDMDALFEVSKRNKNQNFHRECIERMNKNIETFLEK